MNTQYHKVDWERLRLALVGFRRSFSKNNGGVRREKLWDWLEGQWAGPCSWVGFYEHDSSDRWSKSTACFGQRWRRVGLRQNQTDRGISREGRKEGARNWGRCCGNHHYITLHTNIALMLLTAVREDFSWVFLTLPCSHSWAELTHTHVELITVIISLLIFGDKISHRNGETLNRALCRSHHRKNKFAVYTQAAAINN